MHNSHLLQRLAVCSWSLQPKDPQDLADQLLAIGIPRVQLAVDPIRENPQVWGNCFEVLRQRQIEVVSGMMTSVGEDYSTLQSIRITGGIVPDHTWDRNLCNFTDNAALLAGNGIRSALFHAGFLPHVQSDPSYTKVLNRVTTIADLLAARGLSIILETGQEPASSLLAFLKPLNRTNVGVNFDPANMILYNNGDPIQAMQALGNRIRNVHIKDAVLTKVPGTWGEEVVVGTGQVAWPKFFEILSHLDFHGDLCIEREAGNQRLQDIRTARKYLESLG
ncbi:MAG: sugar phosphate isomerase/epimerase family protein [Bacillota bacterium]